MIPLKTVLIVMFLLVGGSLAFKNSPPNGSPRQGKQDWTPITLPARDAYGFCRQDRRHREGVLFTFDSAVPRPYRLLFYTGGNGDEGAIELFLNDEPVGKPLLLPAGWGRELTIRLPSAAVRKGKNTIKIRPATGMPGSVHWGVRDVRVLSENHFRPESLFSTPDRLETVRRALSRNQMGGMELARCYDMIRSWNNRDDPGMSLAEKDRLLKTVEGRMKDELRKVALQVRSREVLGMTPEVEKLLSQTSGWIPFDWSEGWEIYNELSR